MKREFEFIDQIRRMARTRKVLTGIGDDCAILRKNRKKDLAITADMLVEDIDFRLDWVIPKYLGHKALAVSLSDIAAVGAKPKWAMLSIGIPAGVWKTTFVKEFYEGWFKLARKFSVTLIGGDISRTADQIVIDSIVIGEVERGRAILRSGAKTGDLIFVSGEIGGASGGLGLLESGERCRNESRYRDLLLRQLKPKPQIELGRFLSKQRFATSMIDISDGLTADLGHLCDESGVGAEISLEALPLDRNLKCLAEVVRPIETVLSGGEDFELLFTIRPRDREEFLTEAKKFRVTEIGRINADRGALSVTSEGNVRVLHRTGYSHF